MVFRCLCRLPCSVAYTRRVSTLFLLGCFFLFDLTRINDDKSFACITALFM